VSGALNSYNFSRFTMMVADSSSASRKLMVQILKNFGVGTVDECGDGFEAVKLLDAHAYDVLFIELRLPGQSGLEVTKGLRGAQGGMHPFLPVILATAETQRRNVIAARDAGVTEVLAKPISPKTVYARLISVIEKPRPFVKVKGFLGPDRRRRLSEMWDGPDRRGARGDTEIALEAPAQPMADASAADTAKVLASLTLKKEA